MKKETEMFPGKIDSGPCLGPERSQKRFNGLVLRLAFDQPSAAALGPALNFQAIFFQTLGILSLDRA
jgi:hypothetical protein